MSDSMPRALACLAIALCLVLPACGGESEPDHFSSDYNAAIERLDRASQDVLALAPTGKQSRSSRAIARQLDGFADALESTRRELSRLQPPKRAAGPFDQLVAALDKSVAAGRRAADAAREIKPARQRRALRDLRDAALEVAHAQNSLADAVRGSS